jgi:YD repeat-containing protein
MKKTKDVLYKKHGDYFIFYFYFLAQQTLVGEGFLLSSIHEHTQTHHTRWDSSGRVISPTQTLLPDSTQHSQERDVHATGGIRSRNPNKQSAADPRLRSRGHRDRYVGLNVHLG